VKTTTQKKKINLFFHTPNPPTERNRDQMKQEFERLKQELKDKHLL